MTAAALVPWDLISFWAQDNVSLGIRRSVACFWSGSRAAVFAASTELIEKEADAFSLFVFAAPEHRCGPVKFES